MITQTLLAAVGTAAFALLFGVPRRYFPFCAVIGGAGWLLYAALVQYAGATPTEATFFATVLVILLSRACAVLERCPVTVFLICGIFPLVPGAGIYYTAYYFIQGNNALALSNGISTFKVAVALAIGITLVLSVPIPKRHKNKF